MKLLTFFGTALFALATTASAHPFANESLIASLDTGNTQGTGRIDITLGTIRTNIGGHGASIYDRITEALRTLCPENRDRCTYGRMLVETEFVGKGRLIHQGFLEVSVQRSLHRSNKERNLLIDTVANAALISQGQKQNCFSVFKNIKSTFCNIGDFVGVAVDGYYAFLDVKLDMPTDDSKFDCHATETPLLKKINSGLVEWARLGKGLAATVRCLNRPAPVPHNTIYVGLGNIKTYVGDITGSKLYDVIYHALRRLCPEGTPTCNLNTVEHVPVFDATPVSPNPYGTLEIRVENAILGDNPAVRRLFIGSVAAALEHSSRDQKNCRNGYCNVGDLVKVSVAEMELTVRLRSMVSKVARFDCVAIEQAVKASIGSLRSEWQRETGIEHLDMNIHCWGRNVNSQGDTEEVEKRSLSNQTTSIQPLDTSRTLILNVQQSIGNTKTHVGDLTGPALYHAIYTALLYLCPRGKEGCLGEEYRLYTHDIANYGLFPQALYVRVQSSFLGFVDDPHQDGFRRLLIGAIAAGYEHSSLDEKNCYSRKLNHELIKFCNVGGYMGVQCGNEFLNVWVTSKAMPMGKFDCVAVMERVDRALNDLLPEWNRLQGEGVELTTHVYCPETEVT